MSRLPHDVPFSSSSLSEMTFAWRESPAHRLPALTLKLSWRTLISADAGHGSIRCTHCAHGRKAIDTPPVPPSESVHNRLSNPESGKQVQRPVACFFHLVHGRRQALAQH